MSYSVKKLPLHELSSACLVLPIFEGKKQTAQVDHIDTASKKAVSRFLKSGDFKATVGDTVILYDVPGIKAERVMLLGCGKSKDWSIKTFIKSITSAYKTANQYHIKSIALAIDDIVTKVVSAELIGYLTVKTIDALSYQFSDYKTEKVDKPSCNTIQLVTESAAHHKALKDIISYTKGLVTGIHQAKDLANQPGNICDPDYLAQQAKSLDKQYSTLKTTVKDESELEKMGMGAFVSVSKGSDKPGKLITMNYKPKGATNKPIVLVGKGITFDTGGISLKPGAGMDEMKFDMGGAASVFGVMKALCELELPVHVIGVVAAAENMPSGHASRPGDVVTTLSGKTVEILNTDAEGRLVLCDALTYVEQFDPDVVIDIATLTGAVIIALGHEATGVMSNNDELAMQLIEAGQQANDRAWQLPIWEEYHDQLKSPVADFTNLGGRAAGTITAACYLAKFTESYQWAHLDIAGTAWKSGNEKAATGRPVALLMQFIQNKLKQY